MFTTLSDRSAPAGALVASMPVAGRGRTGTGFDRRVASIGEDVRSRFTPDEIVELFRSTGWDRVTITDATTDDAAAPSGRSQLVRATNTRQA
jgi:hypothetical protein